MAISRPRMLRLTLALLVPLALLAPLVLLAPRLRRFTAWGVPAPRVAPTKIAVGQERLIYYDFLNKPKRPLQTATISNTGASPINISLSLTDDGDFSLSGPAAASIPPQGAVEVGVTFSPSSRGLKLSALRVESDEPGRPQIDVGLRGLALGAADGRNEPSLQRILDAFDYPINVDDPDPDTNEYVTTAQMRGQETPGQRFLKAGSGSVMIQPIAAFGPLTKDPMLHMGWYSSGDKASKRELFSVASAFAKSLNPPIASGQTSFDPGEAAFGLYSSWPAYQPDTNGNFEDASYSEDVLNAWEPDPAKRHKLRVFPLKKPDGALEPNAYVVATEESQGGDYQDIVVILRNVKPAPNKG